MIEEAVSEFKNWYVAVINNDFFTFICGLITIVGFAITLYISFKTKSIHKSICEFRTIESYNKNRKKYIASLKAYQDSVIKDKVDIYKIKINILNDVNVMKLAIKDVIKWRQKIMLWKLCSELKKDKSININKICNLLSEIIAFLSQEKERKY